MFAKARQVPPVRGAVYASPVDTRLRFIRRTYAHLAGAVFAFVVIEALFMTSPSGVAFAQWALTSSWGFFGVMIGFIAVGYMANSWAFAPGSTTKQYVGLGLYILAEVLIFCPILYYTIEILNQPDVPQIAGLLTVFLFIGITGTVFITKKDYTFIGGALSTATWVALGTIVLGMLFGFNLGLFFSGLMVLLAGGYITYSTSAIIHHYKEDQHVAAALSLFASVAMMFFYLIRIVSALRE